MAFLYRPDFMNADLCTPLTRCFYYLEPKDTVDTLLTSLHLQFKDLKTIMGFGNGNLVLAGGAVSDSCNQRYERRGKIKDCDLFFWGLKVEESEAIIQNIIKWWLQKSQTHAYRNRYVTTLYDEVSHAVYQLIHRVYPNKSSIIGGFDLAPCMALYDGCDVLFTPMSALTFAHGFFFVDVSRRSTTFDRRIGKYCRKGFRPLLSCKTEMEIRKQLIETVGVEPGMGFINVKIGEYFRLRMDAYECCTKNTTDTPMYDREDYDNGKIYDHGQVDCVNTQLLAGGKLDTLFWECLKDGGTRFCFEPRLARHFGDDLLTHHNFPGRRRMLLMLWFGEKASWINAKIGQVTVEKFIKENRKEVRQIIKQNYQLVKDRREITWYGVNDNPSRQRFTSSFHPVNETISWYNPAYAKPLQIGIPFEVYKYLWLGTRRADSVLSTLSKDVFRYLMTMLRHSMIQDSLLTKMFKVVHLELEAQRLSALLKVFPIQLVAK